MKTKAAPEKGTNKGGSDNRPKVNIPELVEANARMLAAKRGLSFSGLVVDLLVTELRSKGIDPYSDDTPKSDSVPPFLNNPPPPTHSAQPPIPSAHAQKRAAQASKKK